ncbi:PREDICTED: uncharacterized protein LOC109357399 [Lupinus angustifolius]|nr:PREDICTED: uncharacterized protein LOC109357399 [Lupinus angustifolius]
MKTLTLPPLLNFPVFSPSSRSLSLLQTHNSSHPSLINSTHQFPNKTSTILVFAKKDPFLIDEDGFVDDMEGYLQNLSLEYDSVWDTKPSWCQPWTITLTGVSIIAITWFILKSVLVTSLISLLIGAWWFIFLYSYPKAYSQMIAERRQKVTNGVEDTFGVRNK